MPILDGLILLIVFAAAIAVAIEIILEVIRDKRRADGWSLFVLGEHLEQTHHNADRQE